MNNICIALTTARLAGTSTFSSAATVRTLPLSGQWRFQLDAQNKGLSEVWHTKVLPDSIKLPGSTEQNGYGVKTETPAVGRLTRVIMYEGRAWYQRDINIPASWQGQRVELFLERCHWESTVWVDDRPVGMKNSLSVPHLHELGVLAPGHHTLTVCIDNTYKIPIGTWGFSITEDTQGNWNGIIGKIELRATNPVWIKSVQVYPDLLKVEVGNQTGQAADVQVQKQQHVIPADGSVVVVPFHDHRAAWDEFAPSIRTVDVSLKSGLYSEVKQVSYGLREITTKDCQFLLNGRPAFFRGTINECVYPLTGYPPMDKAAWLRVLKICKSYGLNFMRFNSWCPPEAAFEAADDMGFLYQIELPLWTIDAPAYGDHPARDQWIRDELDLILETYGNHPSFGFMGMGNESAGALDTLVRDSRQKDPRRLYRCEGGATEANGDYFETGQRGVIGPRTDWDRRSDSPSWLAGGEQNVQASAVTVPTFAHEVGQWSMYPNFDEIKKYTGTLRAHNFESYREMLDQHHMLDQAKAFHQASGALSMELYKDEIEASLRTWPYGGLQILDARDFPGEGAALVGWLDAFWDSKGLITPEQFRRFCAPTVCLLRMSKRVLSTDDGFNATAEIVHYAPKDIRTHAEWTIKQPDGKLIAHGNWPEMLIKTGRVTTLGGISASFDSISSPSRLVVTVSGAGTSNSWNIWVYPKFQSAPPAGVRIAYAYDAATRQALAAGERVLLFSSPGEGVIKPVQAMLGPDSMRRFLPVAPGRNAVPGSFLPTFWSLRLFNQTGTLGILCDPKHPALAQFPTDSHSDWQWADLLGRFSAADSFRVAGAPPSVYENWERGAGDVANRSKAVILDETPPDYRPIVQEIDNYDRNSKLGVIFETCVGAGRLLVCAMDLETDAERRPAARQLRNSLLAYASGSDFHPACSLNEDLLVRMLTDHAVSTE